MQKEKPLKVNRSKNLFKRYCELMDKQPNLRRDTAARKLRCLEIQVTMMKQRREAETKARDKVEAAKKRPVLHRDKKGNPVNAKRTKKGRW